MPPQPKLTLLQQHREQWKDCTRCPLHEGRSRVVLCRGKIPCDILFVGEAPGQSEDSLGVPFVGPAGYLLDEIIARAMRGRETTPPLRVAFTNLIACIPLDEQSPGGQKLQEPPEESIAACAPRLSEFVGICKPRLIVCVGRHAQDFLTPGYHWSIPLPVLASSGIPIPQIAITHPAAILRGNIAQRDMSVRRCEVIITQAIHQHLDPILTSQGE